MYPPFWASMYILLALSLLLFSNLFCHTSILYTTSPSPPKICPIQYEHMRLDANLLTLCKGREGLSIFFCWCGEICTFFFVSGQSVGGKRVGWTRLDLFFPRAAADVWRNSLARPCQLEVHETIFRKTRFVPKIKLFS